ncbi:hypothetical protein ACTAF0_11035 [Streptomyces murinus]|uniref:hypothetical protein n=1 Tax=Streptomyces murinus TaxID=33900 RepID=UPI003F45C437
MVAALKDDERRLVMSSALRRRSLLLLKGLAAEAVRRGYEVREAGSSFYPPEDGVDVAVDGFAYTVAVRQEFSESTDPERSVRLVVELAHGLTGRPGRWRDRKTRTLEEALGVILGEIEARAAEDTRRRREEQQADVERELRWQAAMDVAKEQAVRERLAQTLREETALAGSRCPQCVLHGIGTSHRRVERCCGRVGSGLGSNVAGAGKGVREINRPLDPASRTAAHP